jgi:hypothetical protein
MQDRQRIKIGLLVILFLYPSIVQSFHISYKKICCYETSANPDNTLSHHAENCPLCQFHFTSYTGTELLELDSVPLYYSFKPFSYDEKEYFPPLLAYFLRGPPSSIIS